MIFHPMGEFSELNMSWLDFRRASLGQENIGQTVNYYITLCRLAEEKSLLDSIKEGVDTIQSDDFHTYMELDDVNMSWVDYRRALLGQENIGKTVNYYLTLSRIAEEKGLFNDLKGN